MCGELEIIIGPMYSGKSSMLISMVKRYSAINKKILVVNHSFDRKRNNTMSIQTHDKTTIPAIFLDNINELSNLPYYNNSDIIIIEEAQFFNGLYDFIKTQVDSTNKKFIVIGLSGGFKRQKLGEVLDLIPICERISKLDALCVHCKDGTLAPFSHRIAKLDINMTTADLVGGSGDYIALCRRHYLLLNSNKNEIEENEFKYF